MSLIYCQEINCQRDTLICIYNCKLATRCEVYYKNYDRILEEPISDYYLDKYGQPDFPLPEAIAIKLKKEQQKEKQKAKIQNEKEKEAKRKEKDLIRKKKEKEKKLKQEAKALKKLQKQAKPKRKSLDEIRLKYGIITASIDSVFSSEPTKKRGRPRKVN